MKSSGSGMAAGSLLTATSNSSRWEITVILTAAPARGANPKLPSEAAPAT